MGKVVKLDSPARERGRSARRGRKPRGAPAAVEDRAGAGRRRLHGRRLRDRRAARARPAVGQPLGQPVRRLRRHERRRAGRRAGRQRRHARADDAGGQQPGADAVPRHQPGHAAAARTTASSCSRAIQLPLHLLGVARVARRAASARSAPSTSRSRWPRRCPPASTPAPGVEEYVRTVLADPDRTDDFRLLEHRALPGGDRPRHVRADRARRRGLGRRPDLARRARLGGAADGLRAGRGQATASWSTAASSRRRTSTSPSRRARSSSSSSTRSCPTSTTSRKEIPTLLGTKVRRVSDMGFPKIAYQTFKLLAYQRLHEMARQWQERYPGVDIVLIEPEPDDELMFQTNILNYTSRLEVARHGFQSVTVKLASDYERPARGRAAPRDRDLRHAGAQGRAPLRRPRRRSRAPGAGSSSRRRARCCASRGGLTQRAASVRGGLLSPRRGRRTGPRTSR